MIISIVMKLVRRVFWFALLCVSLVADFMEDSSFVLCHAHLHEVHSVILICLRYVQKG